MKKLVLLLAVVFSVSLVSCGNKGDKAAATDSVAADTTATLTVTDTTVVASPAPGDTTVATTATATETAPAATPAK